MLGRVIKLHCGLYFFSGVRERGPFPCVSKIKNFALHLATCPINGLGCAEIRCERARRGSEIAAAVFALLNIVFQAAGEAK